MTALKIPRSFPFLFVFSFTTFIACNAQTSATTTIRQRVNEFTDSITERFFNSHQPSILKEGDVSKPNNVESIATTTVIFGDEDDIITVEGENDVRKPSVKFEDEAETEEENEQHKQLEEKSLCQSIKQTVVEKIRKSLLLLSPRLLLKAELILSANWCVNVDDNEYVEVLRRLFTLDSTVCHHDILITGLKSTLFQIPRFMYFLQNIAQSFFQDSAKHAHMISIWILITCLPLMWISWIMGFRKSFNESSSTSVSQIDTFPDNLTKRYDHICAELTEIINSTRQLYAPATSDHLAQDDSDIRELLVKDSSLLGNQDDEVGDGDSPVMRSDLSNQVKKTVNLLIKKMVEGDQEEASSARSAESKSKTLDSLMTRTHLNKSNQDNKDGNKPFKVRIPHDDKIDQKIVGPPKTSRQAPSNNSSLRSTSTSRGTSSTAIRGDSSTSSENSLTTSRGTYSLPSSETSSSTGSEASSSTGGGTYSSSGSRTSSSTSSRTYSSTDSRTSSSTGSETPHSLASGRADGIRLRQGREKTNRTADSSIDHGHTGNDRTVQSTNLIESPVTRQRTEPSSNTRESSTLTMKLRSGRTPVRPTNNSLRRPRGGRGDENAADSREV